MKNQPSYPTFQPPVSFERYKGRYSESNELIERSIEQSDAGDLYEEQVNAKEINEDLKIFADLHDDRSVDDEIVLSVAEKDRLNKENKYSRAIANWGKHPEKPKYKHPKHDGLRQLRKETLDRELASFDQGYEPTAIKDKQDATNEHYNLPEENLHKLEKGV